MIFFILAAFGFGWQCAHFHTAWKIYNTPGMRLTGMGFAPLILAVTFLVIGLLV